MKKHTNYLPWFGIFIVLIILIIVFGSRFRENLEDFTFSKPGTPICPPGSIPNSTGGCSGQCPPGETPIMNGLQCQNKAKNGSGPAPKVPATRCTGSDVLMYGECYKPCSPGSVLKLSTEWRAVGCVKGSSTTPEQLSSGITQQSSSSTTQGSCKPSYKSVSGGSLEQRCFS